MSRDPAGPLVEHPQAQPGAGPAGGALVGVLEQVAPAAHDREPLVGQGRHLLEPGREHVGGQPHPQRVVGTDAARGVGEVAHPGVALGGRGDAGAGVVDERQQPLEASAAARAASSWAAAAASSASRAARSAACRAGEVGRVGGQGRDDVGVLGDGPGRGGVLDVRGRPAARSRSQVGSGRAAPPGPSSASSKPAASSAPRRGRRPPAASRRVGTAERRPPRRRGSVSGRAGPDVLARGRASRRGSRRARRAGPRARSRAGGLGRGRARRAGRARPPRRAPRCRRARRGAPRRPRSTAAAGAASSACAAASARRGRRARPVASATARLERLAVGAVEARRAGCRRGCAAPRSRPRPRAARASAAASSCSARRCRRAAPGRPPVRERGARAPPHTGQASPSDRARASSAAMPSSRRWRRSSSSPAPVERRVPQVVVPRTQGVGAGEVVPPRRRARRRGRGPSRAQLELGHPAGAVGREPLGLGASAAARSSSAAASWVVAASVRSATSPRRSRRGRRARRVGAASASARRPRGLRGDRAVERAGPAPSPGRPRRRRAGRPTGRRRGRGQARRGSAPTVRRGRPSSLGPVRAWAARCPPTPAARSAAASACTRARWLGRGGLEDRQPGQGALPAGAQLVEGPGPRPAPRRRPARAPVRRRRRPSWCSPARRAPSARSRRPGGDRLGGRPRRSPAPRQVARRPRPGVGEDVLERGRAGGQRRAGRLEVGPGGAPRLAPARPRRRRTR